MLGRKYKEHSHQKIEDIKRMQAKHANDLIQPRIGGEINPKFLKRYGAKNIRITDQDVKQIAKKGPTLLKILDKARRESNNN